MENINQTNNESTISEPYSNRHLEDARFNFLEKLNSIEAILKTAEMNETNENKKKEIQEALSFIELRKTIRKQRESSDLNNI
jgi:hypothetical protein